MGGWRAKTAAAKQAADARKSLNTSIDDFQTSLAVAQGMMKDNPALASYITSAQKLTTLPGSSRAT